MASNPFSRTALFRALGFRPTQRLAADFTESYRAVTIPHWKAGQPALVLDVFIYTTATARAIAAMYVCNTGRFPVRPHRIFVLCPKCGREVPAGRYGQHKCKTK